MSVVLMIIIIVTPLSSFSFLKPLTPANPANPVLCHSSTLIHSGLSTNEREVIRTSCPVYSGALFYGREKFRFAEVNQKLLLGLEICAIASTPFVCACRDHIFRQSTELVCRAYGEIYAALSSPANGYKDPEQLVPRSPKQVQTLLSWETLCPPSPVKYVQYRYTDGRCKSWLVGLMGNTGCRLLILCASGKPTVVNVDC